MGKLTVFGAEYWVKDDSVLPLNFDSINGKEKWDYIYNNNLLHRENEPAIIYSIGTKEWYLNGLRHRLDGPAIIYYNGDEYWFLNGLRHRIDGPAIINSEGTKWWFLNDISVNEKMYQKIENSSKEELLMYAVLPKYKNYISLIEYQLNSIK